MQNEEAFRAGQLVQDLTSGYYAHTAAMQIAKDPNAAFLAPAVRPGQLVPIAEVKRKDGTVHTFHFLHYLQQASSHPVISEELERIWFTGAILRTGDVLATHKYFDRAPELEVVRHLRNGVAHGNRFRIDSSAQLSKYPAHNKLAWVKGTEFEISPSLNGRQVLYEALGPGDILDLLMSVSIYLIRMGNGEALRP